MWIWLETSELVELGHVQESESLESILFHQTCQRILFKFPNTTLYDIFWGRYKLSGVYESIYSQVKCTKGQDRRQIHSCWRKTKDRVKIPRYGKYFCVEIKSLSFKSYLYQHRWTFINLCSTIWLNLRSSIWNPNIPLLKIYCKHYTEGLWFLNGSAHWALLFEIWQHSILEFGWLK